MTRKLFLGKPVGNQKSMPIFCSDLQFDFTNFHRANDCFALNVPVRDLVECLPLKIVISLHCPFVALVLASISPSIFSIPAAAAATGIAKITNNSK